MNIRITRSSILACIYSSNNTFAVSIRNEGIDLLAALTASIDVKDSLFPG